MIRACARGQSGCTDKLSPSGAQFRCASVLAEIGRRVHLAKREARLGAAFHCSPIEPWSAEAIAGLDPGGETKTMVVSYASRFKAFLRRAGVQ